MPVQNRDYYGAMQRGREDALNERRARTVNALGELNLEEAKRFNALSQDPNATPDQYARIGRSDVSNALTNIDRTNAQSKQLDAQRLFQAVQYGLQSQTPKEFIARNYPELAAQTPNFDSATDQDVRDGLQELLGVFGPQAGIAPAAPEPQFEQLEGPNGSTIVRRGDKWQVIEQPKSEKPQAYFVPMSAQEIQAAGLPPGTAAQRNAATGQIQVLSKRDGSSSLSQKDAATAKQKLVTINLARQQLQNIQQRFNEIKGSLVAGAGGQGKLPTPKGQAFDRAVDQMRSTLTALTKVPGIGAMSDYETRLDQAKFPNRSDYENVTQQQIDDLKMLVQTMEEGYKGLLNGEMPAQAQAEPDLSQLSDEDLLRALNGG
jgi:ribosomal protein S13